MAVIAIYVYLYSNLFGLLLRTERGNRGMPQLLSVKPSRSGSELQGETLVNILGTQFFIEIGLLVLVPTLMEIGVESGFVKAFFEIITMQLQLGDLFFLFSLGTKAHHFWHTIFHGGSQYIGTTRGFVIRHETFTENYRMYARSHFVKGMEILLMLVFFGFAAPDFNTVVSSSLFILVASWLYTPFLFNPLGFSWNKIVEDWEDWRKWLNSPVRFEFSEATSWKVWWNYEQQHLRRITACGRVIRTILALRFFAIQYGFAKLVTKDKKMVVCNILFHFMKFNLPSN